MENLNGVGIAPAMDPTSRYLSDRRAAVDKAQAALNDAHTDMAAAKGRRMRLMADIEETSLRMDRATDAIAAAERMMEAALSAPPANPAATINADRELFDAAGASAAAAGGQFDNPDGNGA